MVSWALFSSVHTIDLVRGHISSCAHREVDNSLMNVLLCIITAGCGQTIMKLLTDGTLRLRLVRNQCSFNTFAPCEQRTQQVQSLIKNKMLPNVSFSKANTISLFMLWRGFLALVLRPWTLFSTWTLVFLGTKNHHGKSCEKCKNHPAAVCSL